LYPSTAEVGLGKHTNAKKERDGMKTKTLLILLALLCSVSLVANVNAHDVNGDGYANWYDLKLVAEHFGEEGPPGWIPEDVNVDGSVNILDVALVAMQIKSTPAIIHFQPDIIVVPPQGPGIRYITAIIELPEANVQDVDTAAIELLMPSIFVPWFVEGVDIAVIVDNLHVRAQFRADRLIEYLRAEFPDRGLYELGMTVVGLLVPGDFTFVGTHTVNVRII
jgi:hypothetical protein